MFNILDHDDLFVQPYDGYRPPIPGHGREVLVRVGYERALE
jgi:hypothetical protein